MTTHARFDFAQQHLPGSCNPEPGLIQGTLHPDLGGGTYTLEFIAGVAWCAGVDDVTTDGDPVELEVEHACAAGPLNMSVRIVRTEPRPTATRDQIQQRICLA
jgi:hypothetical protein